MQSLNIKNQHSIPLFSANSYPFLARNFASYTRLGPSANRRRTGVLRGLDGRTVTKQMSKRTTKNKKSTKMDDDMQNKPNLYGFYAKNSDSAKKQTQTNPIQTQNKPIFTPKIRPQTKNKPNSNPFSTLIFVFTFILCINKITLCFKIPCLSSGFTKYG